MCFVHELREVADVIERNPGLMTEENPFDAAQLLLMDQDAIKDGYYDPDPFGGTDGYDEDEALSPGKQQAGQWQARSRGGEAPRTGFAGSLALTCQDCRATLRLAQKGAT